MVDIPVVLIDPAGSRTDDVVHGSPCVMVTMGWSPTAKSQDEPMRGVEVWALLDSGADYVYVDHAILRAINSPPVRTLSANALPTSVHKAHFSIRPSAMNFWNFDVCARDIKGHGNGFHIILGRHVLQHGKFVLENGIPLFTLKD